MPRDVLQLAAAHELLRLALLPVCWVLFCSRLTDACLCGSKRRGWKYHKSLQLWFRQIANMEPFVKGEEGERGSYLFFNANTWEEVRKDNFYLAYADVEDT